MLRKRRQRKVKYQNDNGEYVILQPHQTFWAAYYVVSPDIEDSLYHVKFRRRFRLPYDSFLHILALLKEDLRFKRWNKSKTLKNIKLPLLLLGALRYLGRGWCFDDLEEATCISEEVHRIFFHKFITYGAEILYPMFVKYPTNSQEMEEHTKEFEIAGFHGAVGSMDACHVLMEKCSHRLKQNHLGGKSKQTCRSFNLTCNHRRKILHTTCGHPARWNDKTIVLYDKLAVGIRQGDLLNDNIFELNDKSPDGEKMKVKYKGAWLLVDNGYLNWGNTISPMKRTVYRNETRWSEWLESMRKDVECTFGIMKGRFRILKAGIRMHGVNSTDKIWLTCCALHNLLIDVDGLSEEWLGQMGQHDPIQEGETIPYALQRLENGRTARNYDTSGMGPGFIVECTDSDEPVNTSPISSEECLSNGDGIISSNGINDLCMLSNVTFRKKLITHFDILFSEKNIKWPRRAS